MMIGGKGGLLFGRWHRLDQERGKEKVVEEEERRRLEDDYKGHRSTDDSELVEEIEGAEE